MCICNIFVLYYLLTDNTIAICVFSLCDNSGVLESCVESDLLVYFALLPDL